MIERKWEYITKKFQEWGIDTTIAKDIDKTLVELYGGGYTPYWKDSYEWLKKIEPLVSEKTLAVELGTIMIVTRSCVACIETKKQFGSLACWECEFGKVHGKCKNLESDFSKVYDQLTMFIEYDADDNAEFVVNDEDDTFWELVYDKCGEGDDFHEFVTKHYGEYLHTCEFSNFIAGSEMDLLDFIDRQEFRVECEAEDYNCETCAFGKKFGKCYEEGSEFIRLKEYMINEGIK